MTSRAPAAKALVFDVFGTVVDWRGSIIREGQALGREETVGERARQYLNRLSDLLFVLARSLNRAAKRSDVLWQHERKKR